MKIETVYDNGGNELDGEYINISKMRKDTKLAIIQLAYLDETVETFTAANDKDANND